jgi:CheY-like chemotaxis protein
VAEAHDGPEGLATARNMLPDLVFCDISLPDMSGYDVARVIRQDPPLASVFLVALSVYAQPEDMTQAIEAGFDQHLAKPLRLQQLAEVMATAQERATAR